MRPPLPRRKERFKPQSTILLAQSSKKRKDCPALRRSGPLLRGALSRYITHKFSGGQNIIPAYLISKEIEDAVRGAVRQTSGASYLALSPDLHRQLITAMKNVISNVAPHSLPPVILAPMDIRRFMRKLIERDFPDLAVLSYQELDPGANVQPLERIKFVTQLSAA
jgi:type III secretion protein V